jgi:hypothetical protein
MKIYLEFFLTIGDDLSPGAFWFYINTTYFPYDL